MKKLIFLFAILLVVFILLVSCAKDETPETVVENPEELTNSLVEEAVACYYSLKTEDGFENYILAFPSEWRKGYQEVLEYDDETFDIALANATTTVHNLRDEEYQYSDFNIEYSFVRERDVTGNEFNTLTKELSDYCYMTRDTIEKIKECTYSVHTYGVTSSGTIVNDSTTEEKLIMLYITDEGWCVSPHNFDLP